MQTFRFPLFLVSAAPAARKSDTRLSHARAIVLECRRGYDSVLDNKKIGDEKEKCDKEKSFILLRGDHRSWDMGRRTDGCPDRIGKMYFPKNYSSVHTSLSHPSSLFDSVRRQGHPFRHSDDPMPKGRLRPRANLPFIRPDKSFDRTREKIFAAIRSARQNTVNVGQDDILFQSHAKFASRKKSQKFRNVTDHRY